jgi:hypothetical protein
LFVAAACFCPPVRRTGRTSHGRAERCVLAGTAAVARLVPASFFVCAPHVLQHRGRFAPRVCSPYLILSCLVARTVRPHLSRVRITSLLRFFLCRTYVVFRWRSWF